MDTENNSPYLHDQKSLIQSLDRGLQLLEIISQAKEPMGLPELSELLNVDRSTVHRLLGTLQKRNYVVQDAVTKHYSLGLKVIELSRRALDGINFRSIAKPYLKRLSKETGESTNLFILTNNHAVCVDYEASPSPLAVTNDTGIIYIMHATAGGKVLLAFMPEAIQQKVINSSPLPAFTPRTFTDASTLMMHLQQIRAQGYAIDDEERYVGVRCIAAPIFDHTGKNIAGISISGPASRVTLDKIPELAQFVVRAANDISAELGLGRFD
ncbi:transcriptional regulator [Longilinea arvoryzae]|uniref:Glycerol operon regulatory protein n=1 Tax=Longilinea arvoryzae TaxID=360412 RepID=A0A0S7BPP2_9CHLR|nr:IclR family transcriptional regulator [Longilinea arvoryzae]GAP15813.1 transcriptional regulator [Longilinea arvoryzae]